ncbi:MAG: DUF5946 family protein [Verrucomicrobiota bacterium]|nr:DUF5946 family protein [Verrucomicrobiota bacterium]
MTELTAYHELCAYTLTYRDPAFIHQHVVDAFAAQKADEETKPIALTFALVGLYLHAERQFTGREVQRAHQNLARKRRAWPRFVLPESRGGMTAIDVMAKPASGERDEAIHAWAADVWTAFRSDAVETVSELCEELPQFGGA